jgi:hypothetical protein
MNSQTKQNHIYIPGFGKVNNFAGKSLEKTVASQNSW